MKSIFNAAYYYEAGRFTDPESGSRYGINCIRIEPHPVKGALIIATEGHVLGIWHDGSVLIWVLPFLLLVGAVVVATFFPKFRVRVITGVIFEEILPVFPILASNINIDPPTFFHGNSLYIIGRHKPSGDGGSQLQAVDREYSFDHKSDLLTNFPWFRARKVDVTGWPSNDARRDRSILSRNMAEIPYGYGRPQSFTKFKYRLSDTFYPKRGSLQEAKGLLCDTCAGLSRSRLANSRVNGLLVLCHKLFRQIGLSICGSCRFFGSISRIQNGLLLAIHDGSGLRRGGGLIATSFNQPFVLADHLLHGRKLVAGRAILETAKNGESDSSDHHEGTTHAQDLISDSALSKPLKVLHVVVAILSLCGAGISCFYFVLAFLFSERSRQWFFVEIGCAIVSAVGFMILFVAML